MFIIISIVIGPLKAGGVIKASWRLQLSDILSEIKKFETN